MKTKQTISGVLWATVWAGLFMVATTNSLWAKDFREVTQNWDKALDSANGDANGCNSDRFTCIFPGFFFPDGAAVRDNETGLVWERSPTEEPTTWFGALLHCANKVVGGVKEGFTGRKGWRLPAFYELASLIDPQKPFDVVALPTGHPFNNVSTFGFWSATTHTASPDRAWAVPILTNSNPFPFDKSVNGRVWCVRGGSPGPSHY